jgi:formylglycine-generating enzyme required for sulfatase activity
MNLRVGWRAAGVVMQPSTSRWFVLLVFLHAATLPSLLPAQSWVQRVTPAAPSPRNRTAATHDLYRGVTTLFGGYDGGSAALADTWEHNGLLWLPCSTPVRPSGRWGHAMAFDSKRGRAVLFGGVDAGGMFADTWEWDGFSWTQRALSSAPPARGFAAMAYDAVRGVCVLFGGASPNLASLADTWEYDGVAWTQRSTAGAPSPRYRAACAWDEVRRETLVFGGGDGAQVLGDLWAWNGATWSQKATPTAPSSRWDAAMAFDGNCGRAVLLGGADATWAADYGDSWAWDGVAWTQIGGSQPPARHGAVLVHDVQRRQFLGALGRNTAGFRSDTWALGPSCSRSMAVVVPPIVGLTARFRYDYPAAAGNQHFCWTLFTPRQPAAFALPIPGMPTIGLCRVDLFNQLLSQGTFLDGSGSQQALLPIPTNPAVTGFQFDVQSLDLDLFTLTLRWAENDAEVATAMLQPPVANFTSTPASGNAPLLVQFTDTSTNSPTSWQWDFDNDGVVDSTQQNPSWTYTQTGVYAVRLTVANFVGSGSVTRQSCVVVFVPNQPNPTLNMVAIAPGTFQMGQVGVAEPVHQVTLSQPFWMGRCEVTQAQYQALMGSNPSTFQGALAPNAAQRPVEQVSWTAARAYCQALTTGEQLAGRVPAGYQYRLPTEAEWEYCCRAGTTTSWNTGASLGAGQANFAGSLASSTWGNGQTAVVGSYAPNAFGLHDMHGNVAEWCLDSWQQYAPGPVTDPFVTGTFGRNYRGGSWALNDTAASCMSAARNSLAFEFLSSNTLGFRIVLAPIRNP